MNVFHEKSFLCDFFLQRDRIVWQRDILTTTVYPRHLESNVDSSASNDKEIQAHAVSIGTSNKTHRHTQNNGGLVSLVNRASDLRNEGLGFDS